MFLFFHFFIFVCNDAKLPLFLVKEFYQNTSEFICSKKMMLRWNIKHWWLNVNLTCKTPIKTYSFLSIGYLVRNQMILFLGNSSELPATISDLLSSSINLLNRSTMIFLKFLSRKRKNPSSKNHAITERTSVVTSPKRSFENI